MDAENDRVDADLERYRFLRAADQTASRDFDRTLTTLAAGALGISIAFVHDVSPSPKHVWWLGFAWAMFTVSLVFNLSSYLTSQHALRREMRETGTAGWLASLTLLLNWGSAVTFIAGAGSLAWFAYLNISR